MADAKQVTTRVASVAELRAAFVGEGHRFTEVSGLEKPDGWPEKLDMFEYAIARLESDPDEADWRVHLFLDGSGRLVGSGGYHGPPDENGVVEIGYEIAPEFRGKGLGAQAVAELVKRAFADNRVQVVKASTEPVLNASVRILKSLRFFNRGPVHNPDYDDTQWEWGLPRVVYAKSG